MDTLGVKLIKENCILEFVAPGYDRASRRNKLIKLSVLPLFEVMSIDFAKQKDAFLMKHVMEPSLLCKNIYGHETVNYAFFARLFEIDGQLVAFLIDHAASAEFGVFHHRPDRNGRTPRRGKAGSG